MNKLPQPRRGTFSSAKLGGGFRFFNFSYRAILLLAVAALHLALLFGLVFDPRGETEGEEPEQARVMRLTDLREYVPPPPPPVPAVRQPPAPAAGPAEDLTVTEEAPPAQEEPPETSPPAPVRVEEEVFLSQSRLSKLPEFSQTEIARGVVYPLLAQNAGIEGTVYLDLFVNRAGEVVRVTILREQPPDRGFGEAAARAMTGLKGRPAEANGDPVSAHYRYVLRFTLN